MNDCFDLNLYNCNNTVNDTKTPTINMYFTNFKVQLKFALYLFLKDFVLSLEGAE